MRIRARTGRGNPWPRQFCAAPDLVKGMPICRLILAFAWEIPRNRFQENPPLFQQCPVRFLHGRNSFGAKGLWGNYPESEPHFGC